MKNIVLVALAMVVLLAGGCTRRVVAPLPAMARVILLPNDDGSSSGSLVVTNAAGSQQLSEPYSQVEVKAGSAPGTPAKIDAGEVQRLFGDTIALIPPGEARFNLYFETGGTQLTAESAAELPKIIEAYRLRRSTDVTIIGHTDTVGDTQSNYQLGLDRAQQISRAIQAAGVSPAHVFIESHGENDLLVPTPDNTEEPRNRRVEVIVR